MEKYLKIVQIGEIKTSEKNQAKYINVTFKPVKSFLGSLVTSNQKPISRVVWDAHEGKEGQKFIGDQLFKDLAKNEQQIGGYVEGTIQTFLTTPYIIEGKEVRSYSCVVFSNEDAIKYANNQLKANKACVILVGEGGEISTTKPENLINNPLVNTNKD